MSGVNTGDSVLYNGEEAVVVRVFDTPEHHVDLEVVGSGRRINSVENGPGENQWAV